MRSAAGRSNLSKRKHVGVGYCDLAAVQSVDAKMIQEINMRCRLDGGAVLGREEPGRRRGRVGTAPARPGSYWYQHRSKKDRSDRAGLRGFMGRLSRQRSALKSRAEAARAERKTGRAFERYSRASTQNPESTPKDNPFKQVEGLKQKAIDKLRVGERYALGVKH